MKDPQSPIRSHCPINFALETFGDKWSLLIIRDLMFKGKRYYGEFLDSAESISTNILADRLVKLEQNGIIKKSVDHVKRSKIHYSLTKKGKDLLPMLLEMIMWSAHYDPATETDAEFIQKIQQQRNRLVKSILAKLN